MIINQLELTNFRGHESAIFTFKPGINLIAGVNGAGKSTALYALRIIMSRVHRQLHGAGAVLGGETSDIRKGAGAYDLSAKFTLGQKEYEYLAHLDRHETAVGDSSQFRRSMGETTEVWRKRFRKQLHKEGHSPEDIERLIRNYSSVERPKAFRFASDEPSRGSASGFTIFFSAHRSLLTTETSSAQATFLASAQALSDRRFNLLQAAEWWLAQRALATEGGGAKRRADALDKAILEFLPASIQAVCPRPRRGDLEPTLTAVKAHRRFDLFDLSDGERGILALVLEITRRLSMAYPQLDDPTKDGAACILIDEIELHLHPQWQREVLHRLERTFPKCQFIVTTHSPQVIGEVSHDRVHLIGKEPLDQTLGMDSAWILRNVMDTPDRSEQSRKELAEVDKAIKERRPEEALRLVEKITTEYGEFDQLQALRTKAELMLRLRK